PSALHIPGSTDDLRGTVHFHAVEQDADDILRARIADLLGAATSTLGSSDADADADADAGAGAHAAAAIHVGRLCPRCGSAAHGRPWARVAALSTPIGVSLSRSGPHLATACRAGGPIGVDIEEIRVVASRWDEALVAHPSERGLATTALEQARMWSRKEAVLKARGTGLAVPMAQIVLAEHEVIDVPAPPGYVAAVASEGLLVAASDQASDRGSDQASDQAADQSSGRGPDQASGLGRRR
ncbi:MAG: 4'-phosphopantetheinyl transferase family protein, partial [Brachybacterium tyrofermentans]